MGRLDLRDVHRDEDDSVDSSVTSEALGTDVRSLTETRRALEIALEWIELRCDLTEFPQSYQQIHKALA